MPRAFARHEAHFLNTSRGTSLFHLWYNNTNTGKADRIGGFRVRGRHFQRLSNIKSEVNKGAKFPIDSDGSKLSFTVVSECYERKSIMIITNLEFAKIE
ncbi:hypothetical protein FACS1894105_07310 [Clostridia bacterium]|nr:hypothetical protein FACS1894105_07310 [Clostridia bacterium]